MGCPRMKHCLPATLAVVLFVLVGCQDSMPVALRYDIEREIHGLERRLDAARLAPDLFGPDSIRAIQSDYAAAVRNCFAALDSVPATRDSAVWADLGELAFRASTRLSQFLYRSRRYDSAATVLNAMLTNVPLGRTARMNALTNLARSLQSAGAWDSALVVYDSSLERFWPPVDGAGDIYFRLFNAPIQIAGIERRLGDSVATRTRTAAAETYYRQLLAKFPGTKLEPAAWSNLAVLYSGSGEWRQAIDALNRLTDDVGTVDLTAQLRIADIYAEQLAEFDTALIRYEAIDAQLRGEDTVYRPLLDFRQAVAVLNQRRYQEARRRLVQLENEYPGFWRSTPAAQQAKARTFEREGNWERALAEYSFLIENQSNSEEAFQTILYLAERAEEQGNSAEANRWYERAEELFTRVAARSAGTAREASALYYKALMYRQQEQWEPAAETMEAIFARFPNTEPGRQAQLTAALIYRDRLNRPERADELLEALRRSLTPLDEAAAG